MKLSKWFVILIVLCASGCASLLLRGHIADGRYIAPDSIFSVPIPIDYTLNVNVTDGTDQAGSTVSFIVPYGEIYRIERLEIGKTPYATFNNNASDTEIVNGALNNITNYIAAATPGLKEMSTLLKRPCTSSEDTSFVAVAMRYDSPSIYGTWNRAFMTFKRGNNVYCLHYQPRSNDKAPGEELLARIMLFKNSILFPVNE